MPRLPSESNADIVRRINLTLEGPVAEVLAQLVPELKQLPRRGVLEHVLDDPELLDRCFKAFRANTERFHALLVNRQGVAVEEADALLACGRSLDDVVAMVVRTHAKRHFRKRLDGGKRSLRTAGSSERSGRQSGGGQSGGGLMERLVRLFSASQRVPAPARSRGEVLYDAFKEHLRHDWQVPLVQEYSTLSPQLVRRLGKRILDYKVPEDIRRLKDNPDELPVPSTLPEAIPAFLQPVRVKTPAAPPAAVAAGPAEAAEMEAAPVPASAASDRRARLAEVLTPDQKRLRPAAFSMLLLDPAVRAVLPNSEQTVRITGLLSEMGGLPARMLVGELGLRTDQLAVTALSIYDHLGEDLFRRSFGVPGNIDYVTKFVERAKAAGITQDTPLPDLAAFIARMFGGVRKQPGPPGAAS